MYRCQAAAASTGVAQRLVAISVMVALLGLPLAAQAQAIRSRVLNRLRGVDTGTHEQIEVLFNHPIRYLRHSPNRRSRILTILLSPLDIGGLDRAALASRESLRPARGADTAVVEVIYAGDSGEGPTLELHFSRAVRFDVQQGSDFRSILILVEKRTRNVAPEDEAEITKPAQQADRLLVEARRALTANELDRAIALLTKVLDQAEERGRSQTVRFAREYLGLAYQRRGQKAHARAEFEAYLQRWPEGEDAERVRQRLDALLTQRAAPRKPLPEPKADRARPDEFESELYGSVAASYSRTEDVANASSGNSVFDSSASSDIQLTGRADGRRIELEGELVASYRADLLNDQEEPSVSRMLVSLRDRDLNLDGTLGRQTRSNGGVLGRFDGVLLAGRIWEGLVLSAVAGLPVESSTNAPFVDDRRVYGLALDFPRITDGLQGQIFGVAQTSEGFTDRAALGGELRYSRKRGYGLLYLDYDAYFASLNTALFTSSFRLREDIDLNFLVETRNTPVLTTSNALQGQATSSLDTLAQSFSDSAIQDLARDRTGRLWAATVGASFRPTNVLQLAGDLRLSSLSGTPASGGVVETRGTGLEGGGSLQIVRSSWLLRGDVNSATLRIFLGDVVDTYSLSLSGRYLLDHRIRVTPRLRIDYRDQQGPSSDSMGIDPSLRADWRWQDVRIDAEIGLDWTTYLSGPQPDALDYTLELVLRYDF